MPLWAEWVPRFQNEEADALTKSDIRHFRAENRIHVAIECLRFGVLDRLLESGEDCFAETKLLGCLYEHTHARTRAHTCTHARTRAHAYACTRTPTLRSGCWGKSFLLRYCSVSTNTHTRIHPHTP